MLNLDERLSYNDCEKAVLNKINASGEITFKNLVKTLDWGAASISKALSFLLREEKILKTNIQTHRAGRPAVIYISKIKKIDKQRLREYRKHTPNLHGDDWEDI